MSASGSEASEADADCAMTLGASVRSVIAAIKINGEDFCRKSEPPLKKSWTILAQDLNRAIAKTL